jgi:hypothetical protein
VWPPTEPASWAPASNTSQPCINCG